MGKRKGSIQAYAIDVAIDIDSILESTGENASSIASSKSPKGVRGQYAKGWTFKVETIRKRKICRVYNETDYQLTHLLEFGHRAGKSRTRPRPHIRPTFDEVAKQYVDDMKKVNLVVTVKEQ